MGIPMTLKLRYNMIGYHTDRNMAALADVEYAKQVTDSIPVGFYGEPENCAGIVSLLCSEKGRYITDRASM